MNSERIIKFRCWDKNERLMHDVIGMQRDAFVGVPEVGPDGWELSKRKMKDVNLMQFTGLKDLKGREIFEGDIVTNMDGKVGICEYMANIGAAFVFTDKSITEGNTGMKKELCLHCGKEMEPQYDPIAKEVTGYLWRCVCTPPNIIISIG